MGNEVTVFESGRARQSFKSKKTDSEWSDEQHLPDTPGDSRSQKTYTTPGRTTAVDRRQLCAAVVGSLTAISGCLGDSPGDDTHDDEPTRTQTATATDEPTQTQTATATRTIPPYDRSLHDLRVENGREESVTVQVVIRRRDTGDERTLRLRLDPGDSRTYEELDVLSEPVEVRVTVGNETAAYTPQSDGIVVVTVTTGAVEFEEVVT